MTLEETKKKTEKMDMKKSKRKLKPSTFSDISDSGNEQVYFNE